MKVYLHRYAGNGKRPSFGNNFFGYLAMKVIQKHYGHECAKTKEELTNPVEVSDRLWEAYSAAFQEDNGVRIEDFVGRDLLMNGFYQNSKVLFVYRDYLRTFLEANNEEYITPQDEPQVVRVCDIVNTTLETLPGEEDLVIHVRLGDFKHAGNSEILHPHSYFNVLDTLQFKTLYIVVKEPEEAFEHHYLNLFKQRYPNVVIRSSQNLLDDFVFLMKSPRLIISNSTFCWIAAFLGNPKENYVLRNTFYQGQHLDQVNEHSILCPVRYITPDEILRLTNS